MNLFILLALVWLHWLGDFVLQTDEMALNKSKSNYWLGRHVVRYGAFLVPFTFALGPWRGTAFTAVNVLAHFATDYVTSRLTSRLYQRGQRHEFFVVLGADQALHLTALLSSYYWLSQGRL